MKKKNFVRVVVLLLLVSSLSCTAIKNKIFKDKDAIGVSLNKADIVMFDRKAPLVSPGAEAVRRLAQLDPEVAVFVPDIEAVERVAMKKAIDEGLNENKSPKETERKSPLPLWRGAVNASPFTAVKYEPPTPSFGAAMMFQGSIPNATQRTQSAALMGGLIVGIKQIFAESHTSEMSSGAVKQTKTETKDGVTTTMGAELSFNDDGSSGFGMNMKTEAVKNGAKVVVQMEGKVEGFDCPNAEGQVPLTAKLRLWAESGGFGYTQDLTAFIRATVDDNAELVSTTVDLVQGTREVSNGNAFYVETGLTVQVDKDMENFSESNWRLIRYSQGATTDTARPAAESGQSSALAMALTVLKIAEGKWQNGGCVRIDAKSPGSVAVNSTTQIPVKVLHKFGGAEVPSKLEATLSGGASVDPAVIPRTSGTLTYVAPGETGKNATIKLKASSKRGRATLDLTASTGGQQYTVSGTSGPVTFSGQICSLDKQFVINGKFGNGSETQTFTPSSSTSGTVQEAGNSGGCTQSGGGTYKIILNEQGSGTLEFTETVTGVCGAVSNTRTMTFKVSLQPAAGLSCQ